jgi:sugar/nucleoside kinase (ribokinase family)
VSILVVGSVALDRIQTPFGRVEESLGGSATYFSAAASLYDRVKLVAVVGTDFPQEHVDFFKQRRVNLDGLQFAEGKTFRWSGRYGYDMDTAETLDTQLNVFATFRPELPDDYRDSELVFLGNIDPGLQLDVLSQIRSAKLTVLDTMNYWISYRREKLSEAISAVDIVLINEAEVRQYTKCQSLLRGARQILAQGPKALVVKLGQYGAVMTGAGDSFAGGFIGYLAQQNRVTTERWDQVIKDEIKCAIIHGSVVASYTVENFGVEGLRSITLPDILARYQEFQAFTNFAPTCPWSDSCEHLHASHGADRQG